VFTAVLLLLVGRTAPWKAIVAGVMIMAAIWLVFKIALGVRLPAAEFWDTASSYFTALLEGR
jgi:hypothetical protein